MIASDASKKAMEINRLGKTWLDADVKAVIFNWLDANKC